MITYQIVFYVMMICGAVVANAGPINFLKVLINKKKNIKGTIQSILPVVITVTTTTTATITTATGSAKKMMSRDVHVRVVTTSISELFTNNEKSTEFSNNVLIQKLCSTIMHTATMQQNRQEDDDVTTTTAGGDVRSTVVVTGRHKFQRKLFKKKFPSLQFSNDGVRYDFSVATVKPEVRYQDPIVAQEVSRMDYLTSYPLGKENDDDDEEEKYYENWDQPASVWKTVVVGNSVAKSMKNSSDDDDDDDDK